MTRPEEIAIGKNDSRLEKLILVGEVFDSLLVDGQIQPEVFREQLLRASLEGMLLVRQNRQHSRDALQNRNGR